MKWINNLRKVLYFPYSIYLNFKFLPLSQAFKFPIICMCPVILLGKTGYIKIESPVRHGMIRLGTQTAQFYKRGSIRLNLLGGVIFKGKINITDRVFISSDIDAMIIFGKENNFVVGDKIICANKISFGNKVRSSWNCTYIDTDFHPLIDIVRNKPLKQSSPIIIGDGCWIGHDSIVSKGSKLAKNTTVASGSVVKGFYKKENCIIGGNLASILDEGYVRDDCWC